MGKVIIFSAPSGSGKTTIVRHLLARYPQVEFSISATSRAPRGTERDGEDYYFLTHEQFMQAVADNRFVEWEEVYQGTCYGTLRSEMERIWQKGHAIAFDVDVIDRRVAKAEFELTKAPGFDHIVVNDRLEDAVAEVCELVGNFIGC